MLTFRTSSTWVKTTTSTPSSTVDLVNKTASPSGCIFYARGPQEITRVGPEDIQSTPLPGESMPDMIKRAARALAVCRRMATLSVRIYKVQHAKSALETWGSSALASMKIAMALRNALGKTTAFEKALGESVATVLGNNTVPGIPSDWWVGATGLPTTSTSFLIKTTSF